MKLLYFLFIIFLMNLKGQSYTSQWYNTDNGLPQNSVKDIIKDKYGFIWLATENGLVKYDGKQFTIFNDPKSKNYYPSIFLGNLQRDYILTYNDINENIQFITQRKVVVKNGPITEKTITRKGKNYTNFYIAFKGKSEDKTHSYFIRVQSGIYYFEKNRIIYENHSKYEIIIPIQLSDDILENTFVHGETIFIPYIINKKMLFIMDGKTKYEEAPSIYTSPKSKFYRNLLHRQVFIVNKDIIYRSSFQNNKLVATKLITYKNFGYNYFNSLYYDEAYSNLYLGSYSKGLNIVKISNFSVSLKNGPYESDVFYAAMPFGKDKVITEKGGVYNKFSIVYDYKFKEEYSRASMIYDSEGNIISKKQHKLFKRYKKGNFHVEDTLHINAHLHKQVNNVFKSKDLYIISLEDSLGYYLALYKNDKFDKTNQLFKFKWDITCVTHYDNNHLLVGNRKGLFIISLVTHTISRINGSQNLFIKSIKRTSDGNFWLTTVANGFYLLKNNHLINMPLDPNKYIVSAHCILEDNHDGMWISTNNGLFKVLKRQLLSYSKNRKTKVYYHRFTRYDGFKTNEFNGLCTPCANILPNGNFVFPSLEGLVFFNPDNIHVNYPQYIYVERAKIQKSEIDFTHTLTLPKDYKMAIIYIDVPYYGNTENLYVEARLEGSESSSWERIEGNRYTISNVSPGHYQLHIRALVSENGQFIDKTISVEIKPYFYQTILFKTLVPLLGLIILFLIIQLRTNSLNKALKTSHHQLKNASEHQRNLIEAISHDITTPVKYITLISQKLHEAKEDTILQKEWFKSIFISSEQLYKFTLGLKDYAQLFNEEGLLNLEICHIYEEVEEKKLLFEEIGKKKNIIIHNFCDPQIAVKANKKILTTILHNIIDNAVKYTSDGDIFISTYLHKEQTEIVIEDTGKGMSQEQIKYYSDIFKNHDTSGKNFKKYGLGLHMVLPLVKKLNWQISFHPNTPKGTKVKIIIKKI
ncbi:sensor histidine kinase [Chryseobacterium potabilaquae]|uniref:Sensor histidine kinase ResE n=1 Tax=Chryseobacterium potabilaquae TaxID=2675057 RepID=A0A6N4XA77_9FLAO|nr:HAMP domain-containing sensor histidine kinase [Chryseobacterium potabilaquae]CAA7196606.1 Sensor histidine kinase ResE [Chryseobacterium potabilaquae]